ncbi:hypothetical protein C5S30_05515 [ANME-1 cluster archaeon GoMg4]|nr:hypothetical protein [ANME-1 cluster archaeon GoMg4]
MMKGRLDNKNIAKAVKALNVHLPAERKTLSALLTKDKPAVQGRDGAVHRIKREELEEIARLIPEEAHGKLRLPIYIELTSDYGRGIAKVHGKWDCELVRRILGKGRESSEKVDEIFVYRDDVRRLRRTLPTTTEYAFFYSTSF